MELLLRRIWSNSECVTGTLNVDGVQVYFTLEPPIRFEKIAGDTAIPAGRYRVTITHSPKFKRDMPLLLDVPDFETVRIHWGNKAKDTDGCILVGNKRQDDTTILESRAAFDALAIELTAAFVRHEEIWIEIESPGIKSATDEADFGM